MTADIVDLSFHRWASDTAAGAEAQSRLAADIADLVAMGSDESDRLARSWRSPQPQYPTRARDGRVPVLQV
jgi:hypothetical protein